MAAPSPVGDVEIVSPVSTFVLNRHLNEVFCFVFCLFVSFFN